MNGTITKKIERSLSLLSLDIHGLIRNHGRELEMANKRTQDVAKAADNYMGAVVYWSDFMSDHPDSEYYDKETEREYKRLTNAKWKAYNTLKKYINCVLPAKK